MNLKMREKLLEDLTDALTKMPDRDQARDQKAANLSDCDEENDVSDLDEDHEE